MLSPYHPNVMVLNKKRHDATDASAMITESEVVAFPEVPFQGLVNATVYWIEKKDVPPFFPFETLTDGGTKSIKNHPVVIEYDPLSVVMNNPEVVGFPVAGPIKMQVSRCVFVDSPDDVGPVLSKWALPHPVPLLDFLVSIFDEFEEQSW